MPQFHRSRCKVCDRPPPAGARISGTGLCPECGERRHLEHNRQMIDGRGPWFDYWRHRSLAALGVGLLETPRAPQ